MARKLDIREITHTQKFSYPSGVAVELYKGKGIFTTEALLYLVANVTVAAGAVIKEDALIRLIKSFKISAGSTNFVNFQDGRQMMVWANTRLKGNVRIDPLPTSGTATLYGVIPLHFGIQPYDKEGNYNPYDFSSVIPGESEKIRMTSLQASMEWGASADLGTGITINSATIQVLQKYIMLSPTEISEIYYNGIPTIRLEIGIHDLSAIKPNRGARFDLPPSAVVNNSILMATDINDKRSEEEISELSIEFTLTSTSVYNLPWVLAQTETQRIFQLPSATKGIVAINWAKQVPENIPGVGYSTYDKDPGETQIGASVAKTGGKLHIIDHCVNLLR